MAGNRIICEKNDVDYIAVRRAMCNDARTKEELKEMIGVCLECEECESSPTSTQRTNSADAQCVPLQVM